MLITIASVQAQPAAKQPGEASTQDRIAIPGAAFELPLVRIPGDEAKSIKPFFMSVTEVPWEAYDAFLFSRDTEQSTPAYADAITRPSKPYLPPDRGFGHDGFAAITISFANASEYCAWLSAATGRRVRLATEAEWEHAARAGGTGRFGVGDSPSVLADVAWFDANSGGKPHAVGSKKPNAWGLHDMLGNVEEWTVAADGSGVTKGGAYNDPPERLAIDAREPSNPKWNASDPQLPKSKWWLADAPFVGFRIVVEIDDSVSAQPAPPQGETK